MKKLNMSEVSGLIGLLIDKGVISEKELQEVSDKAKSERQEAIKAEIALEDAVAKKAKAAYSARMRKS